MEAIRNAPRTALDRAGLRGSCKRSIAGFEARKAQMDANEDRIYRRWIIALAGPCAERPCVVNWVDSPPLPHDTDHHAMAIRHHHFVHVINNLLRRGHGDVAFRDDVCTGGVNRGRPGMHPRGSVDWNDK